MVESIDNQNVDNNENEQPASLSLRERVRKSTQAALGILQDWRNALTKEVEVKTVDELQTLHTEVVASTPEVVRSEFETLKQEVVEQHQQIITDTVTSSSTQSDTYISANLAADQDPSSASPESIRKNRAEAANRVATMIDEELFDPRSWTLI
jgi:hypothetical protein